MLRRKENNIHINQERWLVSYADFITLLFAFFVVMYSISQVNESKYRVLSETFVQAFNQPNDSKANPMPQEKVNPSNDVIAPIEMGKTSTEESNNPKEVVIVTDTAKPEMNAQSNTTAKTDSQDELTQISNQVSEKFAQLINDNLIQVSGNQYWLQIELNEKILFPSGEATTSGEAKVLLLDIADILKKYKNNIQIEGFTDNIPINSSRFPTNWELSSARATEIVKFLITEGVQPERLSAVAFGEYQPVASNETEQGRARNRRIAIMVAKQNIPRPESK